MRIAGSSLDGENAALNVEERNIKGTAAEVIDEDVPLLLRLARAETIRDGGRGRLVDDAEHLQIGNGSGVFGRLSLVVVEVRWHGDDGLLDLLA